MIQRIQTVSILLAIAGLVVFLFLPFAQGVSPDAGLSIIDLLKPENAKLLFGVGFMAGIDLAILILLISLFLFKNRPRQYRMISVATLISLLVAGFAAAAMLIPGIGLPLLNHPVALAFPPVSILFLLLANRQIKKDEQLVRSVDRIR